MKLNYTLKQLNSSFDDNAFFVRNVYKKKAVLFDCGRLGTLENSELLDISDVFVTHTHIDHFAGFDRFLRGCLNSGSNIRFFGPKGIIKNIRGRLDSYTWNLIKDYDLTFTVIELDEKGNSSAVFSAKREFNQECAEINNGDILLDDKFTLKYDFFDHGITSIGYRFCEPKNISIVKEHLDNLNYKTGAWLKILKNELFINSDRNKKIEVQTTDGNKDVEIGTLEKQIVEYKAEQDITYITDIAPTLDNYKKAIKLASNSNLLIIESVFMNEDIEHAETKKHLNIGLAKSVFIESKSDYVKFVHFAPKYDRLRNEFFHELNLNIYNKIFPFK